ncbi:MAG: hypothetical protein R3F11_27600 [Verrucomicrobiales bacterium]
MTGGWRDFDISGAAGALVDGENVLAVAALTSGVLDTDFIFEAQLIAAPIATAPRTFEYDPGNPPVLNDSVQVTSRILTGELGDQLGDVHRRCAVRAVR